MYLQCTRSVHHPLPPVTADHSKRIARVEYSGAWEESNSLLSSVDDIWVKLFLRRYGPILALQPHPDAGRQVLRNKGRHSDTQVNIETISFAAHRAIRRRWSRRVSAAESATGGEASVRDLIRLGVLAFTIRSTGFPEGELG